jgi:hypothetical protein
MATKYLAQSPRFRATDNNGNPLSGGLLTAYQAGTTTIATTYSNSAGTTNTPVVTLDAEGEASVYLTPGLKYDFRLTDSVGYLVWTATRVSAPVTPSTYFATLMDETTQLALFNIVVAPGGTVTGDFDMEAAYNYAVPVALTSATTTNIGAAASNTITLAPQPPVFDTAWNPTAITYSIGNTKAASNNGGNYAQVKLTSSGSGSVSFLIGTATGAFFCLGVFAPADVAANSGIMGFTTNTTAYAICSQTGGKHHSGSNTPYFTDGSTFDYSGSTITVVFDATAGTLTYLVNGVSQGLAFTGIPSDHIIGGSVITTCTLQAT